MKSIWIPPQQAETRKYLRWCTVTAFVIVMLGIVSVFVDEWSTSNDLQQRARKELEQAAEAARAAEAQRQAQAVRKPTEPPRSSAPMPPPLPDVKVEASPTHIEIDAKLLRVVMDNEASWMAIVKIVVTILATFFGIRLINFGFARLEPSTK